MTKDKEYVLNMARENDVRFIRLWFTDILGFLKNFGGQRSSLYLSLAFNNEMI